MSTVLELKNVYKDFVSGDQTVRAVNNVSFSVEEGELFSLLGPSGCGKTTTLRILSGLEQVSDGAIIFAGQDFTRVPSYQRGIGMVFQSYALYPHMTVFENVAYGLRVRKTKDGLVREKVEKTLDLVGLAGYGRRKPAEMSGGQQQRVALARALVYDPLLLLLDEPLSNLDAKLRIYMRNEIRRIQQEAKITAIYVTHDQEEALSISDKIAVMDEGVLQQVGSPQEIYERPTNLHVADFIGSTNMMACRHHSPDSVLIDGETVIRVRESQLTDSDQKGTLVVRPERLTLVRDPLPSGNCIRCTLSHVLYLGNRVVYTLSTSNNVRVVADEVEYYEGLEVGEEVWVALPQGFCMAFAELKQSKGAS